uniref:Uncharacterized protein n=1 Tax=Zea mays TaxID=4577 RepID=A0A804MK69_MAIZE
MKKEKDVVMEEYLSLKEANKQLKEEVAKTSRKPAMPAQQQAAESLVPAPPRPGFLYSAAPPAPVPVPYVWGSWPPSAAAGSEQHGSPPPLCLQPCAWYYPAVADPRGSPSSAHAQQPPAFQDPRAATGEEDTDDDPCSLTLGLEVDKRSAPVGIVAGPASGSGSGGGGAQSDRDRAAQARRRRRDLTKLKHTHAAARPGSSEQW